MESRLLWLLPLLAVASQKPPESMIMLKGLAKEESPTVVVPLAKHVAVTVGGRQVSTKVALSGEIFIGLPVPQRFTVVFDTGSGHLTVPSSDCESRTCKQHNRYKAHASATGVAMNSDGTPALNPARKDRISISYGTGEIVGDFAREVICIGAPQASSDDPACTTAWVITATTMTDDPFQEFAFDGVFGLGLPPLSLDPEFHMLGLMTKSSHMASVFGFFISDLDEIASELTLGGHDRARAAAPLHWVPVPDPEEGHWKVRVISVRIGNQTLDYCGDGTCVAIVDTGTSIIGAPSEVSQELLQLTAHELPLGSPVDTDCREVAGPALVFELEGGFMIKLAVADYIGPMSSSVPPSVPPGGNEGNTTARIPRRVCRMRLLPLSMPEISAKTFLFGQPVLLRYYTAYSMSPAQVGFAISLQGVLDGAVV